MNTRPDISVYDYFDYRKFCSDYFIRKKALNPHFSHRLFAHKAELTSCGYFSEVVSGVRNLSKGKVANFTQGLELEGKERAYFEALVAFNHAKTHAAKRTLYGQLIRSLPQTVQQLRRSQMDYFSKWHYVAVREALSTCDAREDDVAPLAERLRPGVTVPQIKAALQVLRGLGLVEKDAQGRWRAKHATLLPIKDESADVLVRSFQAEMIGKAREALDAVLPEQRDISSSTLSVSADGMHRIKGAIADFQAVIRKIVQSDKDEDRVMQFNLQFFPLTRIGDEHA